MISPIARGATAQAFWQKAGGRGRYGAPVRIAAAASAAFPVSVIPVPNLDTSVVGQFLLSIRSDPWMVGAPRPLRGCLVADAGHALIFVESRDSEDEQRFTVAHELSHLLLHYLAPRAAAVQHFGTDIMAVLDRTRPATYGERMNAAMNGVPIEPFRHAMNRDQAKFGTTVDQIEGEADDLAVELLAPWDELKSMQGATPARIREAFGLPTPVALRLASLIAPTDMSEGVIGLFRLT